VGDSMNRARTCATAWKHALASHARRSRTRSRTPLLLSQKPSVRTCPPLTLCSLVPSPNSTRSRALRPHERFQGKGSSGRACAGRSQRRRRRRHRAGRPTIVMPRGWPVNPGSSWRGPCARKQAPPGSAGARLSTLGCQLRPAASSIDGAICAAGRSLPDMSLAFALMAAINGSTGSWATLSHGLQLPHHASPASTRRHQGFSSFRGSGARGRPGRCRTNLAHRILFVAGVQSSHSRPRRIRRVGTREPPRAAPTRSVATAACGCCSIDTTPFVCATASHASDRRLR